MAEVLLFHHAQGLTPGIHAFADTLRAAGHRVHTPDLFDGRTFRSIDEGMARSTELRRVHFQWRIALITHGDDTLLFAQVPQQALLGDTLRDPGHHPVLHPPGPRLRARLVVLFVPILFRLAQQLTEPALPPREETRWLRLVLGFRLYRLLVVEHVLIGAHRDHEDVHGLSSTALIGIARAHGDMGGQIFALMVMVVAACEVAVGLGLIVALYRRRLPIDVDELRELQG